MKFARWLIQSFTIVPFVYFVQTRKISLLPPGIVHTTNGEQEQLPIMAIFCLLNVCGHSRIGHLSCFKS